MAQKRSKIPKFWQELRRRRVFNVIVIYASVAWLLIQLVNNLLVPLNLPTIVSTVVIIAIAVGFPLTLILAWMYDLTPEGIEKTSAKDTGDHNEGIFEDDDDISKTGAYEEVKKVVPRAWRIATYVSFVVIVGLLTINLAGRSKHLRPGDIESLLILPFDNFTGDDMLEYFVSGMHASLIGDIGKIGGLRVTSKTTSNTYKDVDLTIPEIASELSVDAVVETQVMCVGDTICLQVRVLTPFPEEKQVWAGDYREEKSQILNLYNRVTRQIASEVMIELSPEEERVLNEFRTVNKEAYDAYLMGLFYWDKLSKEALDNALKYFNKAIQIDPEWAPPYSGIAQVWVGLAQMGFASPEIAGPMIFENLNKALELDPDFAASHYTQGIIGTWIEWNWEKGEREFLRALELNPNDAMSRIYYAHLLTFLQRGDEAISQGQMAVDLDPLNPLILSLFAVVLGDNNQWEEAFEYVEKAISIDPFSFFAHHILEFVSYEVGNTSELLKALRFVFPFDEEVFLSIENTSREKGLQAAYEETVRHLETIQESNFLVPVHMANRYARIQEYDKLLDQLEMGLQVHDQNMPYIANGFNNLTPVYKDPRFIALMEKLNLPMPEV